MSTNDRMMTPNEVADYIQIPEATLEKWRYLRKGPDYIPVGRHVRYRRSAVDAWLDSRRQAVAG